MTDTPDTLDTYADEVIAAVCLRHGITRAELLSRRKKPRFVRAREDACRLFRATVRDDGCVMRQGLGTPWGSYDPLSYPKIGRLLGVLHHTAVILAERRGARCTECENGIFDRHAGFAGRATRICGTCQECSGTGKLPPLTWDAYMKETER